jgi:tetratricopeptide (TPR) repeat protein
MPENSPQRPQASAALAQAVKQHRAGHAARAAELYREVLALDPEQADVWRYLGAAQRDCGEISAALDAFQQAVKRAPENASYRAELATTLHGAGRLQDAVEAYQAALDGDPTDHACRNNLAGALSALGRKVEAVEEYRKALQGDPDNVDIIVNLGVTLRETGNPAEAAELLRLALETVDAPARAHAALADACADLGDRSTAIDEYRLALLYEPENALAEAGASLGVLLQREGRTEEAFAAYREALRRDPGSVLALTNLGALKVETGQLEEALTPLQEAVGLAPTDAPARCNLGAALQRLGRADEAETCLQAALEMDDEYAAAWGNMGNVLQDKLRLDDALQAHNRALMLEPENPELHWNRAMTLLLAGDLKAGFEEYEWRLKMPKIAARALALPVWQGEDPVGASILLVGEQGLGDTIQFARFAPLLAKKGARVAITCARSLVTLLATLDGVERVVAADDPVPSHDYNLPLMSLPHRLGITSTTIPGEVPYLSVPGGATPPPDRGTKRRIGISWSGNPEHPADRQRSSGLAVLGPLFDRSGIEWISLQFGPGVEAIVDQGLAEVIADWGPYLDGFGDTAAALDAIDLVITIDSAAAHLAGALGRPVWLMLKYAPDWRWAAEGDATPWYPTMRLFRQQQPGDWSGVVDRVAQALDGLE